MDLVRSEFVGKSASDEDGDEIKLVGAEEFG